MYTKRSVAPYCFGKLARNRFREPEQRFIALEICIGRFYFYLFADTNIHLIFHIASVFAIFFCIICIFLSKPLEIKPKQQKLLNIHFPKARRYICRFISISSFPNLFLPAVFPPRWARIPAESLIDACAGSRAVGCCLCTQSSLPRTRRNS